MTPLQTYLKRWTIEFIESKDAFFRKIDCIDRQDGAQFLVRYKDGREVQHFIVPTLHEYNLSLSAQKHYALIVLNTKKNLHEVISRWKEFVEYKHLTFIFVNPFSASEKKWIVMPHTHNKVCDMNNLELGLQVLFDTVDQTDEKQLKELI